ncbi:MAG: NADH-quinone oxidoreductase subunit L [Anaerolineales bacterium]
MFLSQTAGASGLFAYAPLIIAFPLLGLLINVLFGSRFKEGVIGGIASGAVALGFGVALLQYLALQADPEGARVLVAEWINIGGLDISWALKVDTLSVTMMLMVTGVSMLIHIYAIGYMHDDVRFQGDPGRFRRFFVYFNLFVAAMMILVTADNYLMMFVGWEGVGLCSYLLIGFWFEKGRDGIGNAIAGKKAFVVNRIGDFGFLIAMFLIFWTFGSLQFDEVFHEAELMGAAAGGAITLITLFILLGVTGKSAQLPLFVWLPDAMAGPTPVSALIHAATMVTAGVYLIARNAVLFELAPVGANAVAWVGGLTALFAATIAVAQFDIKRVLAYSTISQLGFMVAAVGLGAYVAGMFHLVTHAFFKALLFLGSGSVIQGVEHGHHHLDHHDEGGEHFDPQDMRNMGGLRERMPTTFVVYLIGALALAGIPPLAGFFSKDEILLDASLTNAWIYGLLTVSAFLTAFYMGRQIWLVFFGQARSEAAAHAHESPPVMTMPLIGLAGLAVVGGAINLPGLHPLTDWLHHTLEYVHAVEFDFQVAAISTGLALAAIAVAWAAYGRRTVAKGERDPLRSRLGPLFTAMESKWWVDEAYQVLFVRTYEWAAYHLAMTVDWHFWHDWFHDSVLASSFRGGSRWLAVGFDLPVIDGFVNGLAGLINRTAKSLGEVETGYVRNYALSLFVGTILVISYLLLH